METSWRSFFEQMTQTDASAIDGPTADALRAFCAASPEIETAYVCAVERTQQGGQPEHALTLAVKLTLAVVVDPGDGGKTGFELRRKFIESHPDLAKRLGFRVITDRAVGAYEHYALTVYSNTVP